MCSCGCVRGREVAILVEYNDGAKGVISRILPVAPKGEFTEGIQVFISPIGVFARKNLAMLKEIYLGKIFFNLNKKIKEMATSNVKHEQIVKLITDIYDLLGSDKVRESISKNLKELAPAQLRKSILNGTFQTYLVIEPFTRVDPKNIKSAADVLEIPLEEKVYIPEYDQWTDVPVPVGISYYNFLEHYSEVYSSVRGSEKYIGLTGQPTKGKAQHGGQALGNLDTFALLTYDVPHIMDELYSSRSDDHKSKRIIFNNIIQNGELPSAPKKEVTGGTKYLFDLYFLGMGLEVS